VEKGDIVERGSDINEEGSTNKVFIDLENVLVVLSAKLDKQDWFLDFGASKPITRNKSCFSFMGKVKRPMSIRSNSDQSHPIKGKGNVSF
jgi:hypothetical protein